MSDALLVSRLINRIERLERTVRQMSTRMNNIVREGKVVDIDYSTGMATVDAQGVMSPPTSWLEPAGDIVEWNPPSKGQRVMLFSPSGDMGRSFIMPGGYTEDVKQPHDRGAEKFLQIGGMTSTFSGEGWVLKVGGVIYRFTADGFKQDGGYKLHNDLNVGSTHVHGGVTPGGADTAGPH